VAGLYGLPDRRKVKTNLGLRKVIMSKLKTKSSVKKRFKLSATGKVIMGQAGKRHGMIKRTNKQIRNQRGTTVMSESDAKRVRRHFAPYGL
jgi:large subunit ribosomal protein L35